MASKRVPRRRGQMGPKRSPKAGAPGYANQGNPYVSRGMNRPTGLQSWTADITPPNSGTPSPQRPSPRTRSSELSRRRSIMKKAGRPKRRLKPYKRRGL
tara:strand:+ start:297 stop:593 length:297 start_codon:yes stop_codon:yes gene_type:complete